MGLDMHDDEESGGGADSGRERQSLASSSDNDDGRRLLKGKGAQDSALQRHEDPLQGATWRAATRKPLSAYRRTPWVKAALAEAKYSFCAMILGTKLNYLLVSVPLAAVSHYLKWSSGLSASLAMVSLCPLAERLGFVTEQLALRTNDTLGALLNVTFGNATELILSIVALKEAQVRLIHLSLLGSVLSNSLIVLGSAMVVGGLKHKNQKFERKSTLIHVLLLFGSALVLLVPMLLEFSGGKQAATGAGANAGEGAGGGGGAETPGKEGLAAVDPGAACLWSSRIISVVLGVTYGLFLYITLRQPSHQSEESGKSGRGDDSPPLRFSLHNSQMERYDTLASPSKRKGSTGDPASYRAVRTEQDIEMAPMELGEGAKAARKKLDFYSVAEADDAQPDSTLDLDEDEVVRDEGGLGDGEEEEEEEEEEDEPMSTCSGIFWLGVIAILISWLSDILVDDIRDGAAEQLHLPSSFLYAIVLPIVGNAAEHSSALIFSYKNKPEIAFGIAVGSSVQVALMVIPLTVLVAWIMGTKFALNFEPVEAGLYVGSLLLLTVILRNGKSNWVKGAILVFLYFVLGVAFWFV